MSDVRFAVVDPNGLVINLVMAPASYKDPTGLAVFQSDTACIGWTTADQGKTFVSPALTINELLALANAAQNYNLNSVWTFDVGTSGSPLLLTTMLDVFGQAAMLKLTMWGQINQNNNVTEAYSNVDYTGANITPAQAFAVGTKAGAVLTQSYSILNDTAAKIRSGALTTETQVAAVAWPDPSQTR